MKVIAIAVLFLLSSPSMSQTTDPPPPFDEGVADVQVPFDDWVFVLVAVVIGYGLVRAKFYRINKNNKEPLLQD